MLKTASEVGQTIKSLRVKNNFTQEKMADLLGVSPQAVSKWERGEGYPDVQQIDMLADLFNITFDELMRLEANNLDNEIKTIHEIWQIIETEQTTFKVTDYTINNSIEIHLQVKNISNKPVRLKSTQFHLFDPEGASVKRQEQNHYDEDGNLTNVSILHLIPEMVLGNSTAEVKLVFENIHKDGTYKLFVKEFDENAANPYFEMRIPLLRELRYSHINNLHHLNDNDAAYCYNTVYGLFGFHEGVSSTSALEQKLPKINWNIYQQLIIPKDTSYISKCINLFDDEVSQKLISSGEYISFKLAKAHAESKDELRSLVKSNFDKIEQMIVSREDTGIFSIKEKEEWMDDDIMDFMIMLYLKYTSRISKWTIEHINDCNFDKFKDHFEGLPFKEKIYLFESKVDKNKVNKLILESNTEEFGLDKILSLKKYFGESIFQSTIDELALRYELENLDQLKFIKGYISEEAFEKAKDRFFENEVRKNKSLKDSL
jgi:transcriptional regulator with XRE-family HTH domain